ncbi:MAG: FkbM family methyltransferase [Thermodesulfobacteriota bacterium]|nr:FkbM family methyltransferase [Thermodesulfobacteriota bacterium]
MQQRRPTMKQSLLLLRLFDVPISAIVDIGVQTCTPPLMEIFPDKKHFLFEPIDSYLPQILSNYQNFNIQLTQVALSDSDGQAWQVGRSADGSGKVTHSYLSDHKINSVDDPTIIECTAVHKAKFDTICTTIDLPEDFLLKIDVDGIEIKILNGATKSIQKASVIIIEAPLTKLTERAQYVEQQGFKLFDMVDLSYYYGTLSQVDLILVRNDLVGKIADLNPWKTKKIHWDAWFQMDETYWQATNK